MFGTLGRRKACCKGTGWLSWSNSDYDTSPRKAPGYNYIVCGLVKPHLQRRAQREVLEENFLCLAAEAECLLLYVLSPKLPLPPTTWIIRLTVKEWLFKNVFATMIQNTPECIGFLKGSILSLKCFYQETKVLLELYSYLVVTWSWKTGVIHHPTVTDTQVATWSATPHLLAILVQESYSFIKPARQQNKVSSLLSLENFQGYKALLACATELIQHWHGIWETGIARHLLQNTQQSGAWAYRNQEARKGEQVTKITNETVISETTILPGEG